MTVPRRDDEARRLIRGGLGRVPRTFVSVTLAATLMAPAPLPAYADELRSESARDAQELPQSNNETSGDTDAETAKDTADSGSAVEQLDPSTVPFAPDDIARLLSVKDSNGAASWRLSGSDAPVLWMNSQAVDDALQVSTANPASGSFSLSRDCTLTLDGSFASSGAGTDIPLSAGMLYLMAPYDVSAVYDNGSRRTFAAGTVLRLPVQSDVTAPTVSDVAIADASGTALDASAQDGTVRLPSSGAKVTAQVSDPQPADAELTDEERAQGTSGIDAASVQLSVSTPSGGISIPADSVTAEGLATFTITLDKVGGGTFALSDVSVGVSDEAGNHTSTGLTTTDAYASGVRAIDIATRIALAQTEVQVPYGVDVEKWLVKQPLLLGEDGTTRLSVSDLSSSFASADDLIDVAGDAYPAGGSVLSLTWGTQTDQGAADIPLPDLSGLTVSMASVDEQPGDSAALPIVSNDTLASLVSDADGAAGWRVFADDQGTTSVWLGANDSDVVLKAQGDAASLSETSALLRDGSFIEPAGELVLSGAGQVFVKLASEDGAVARIPVLVDSLAPTIGEMSVTWADGSALDEDSTWIEEGSLYVPPAGIRVSVPVTDEGGSGVDGDTIALSVGDDTTLAPESFDGTVATFLLTPDALGGVGTYDLDALSVHLHDRAHNEATTELTAVPAFSELGVTSLEAVDQAAQAGRPQVEMTLKDLASGQDLSPNATDGVYYTNAAAGASLTFRLSDERYEALLGKSRWVSSQPIWWRDKGTYAGVHQIAPDSFKLKQGTSWYQSTVRGLLPAEGTYDVTYHYTGANLFLWWDQTAEAQAKVVVDRTDPAVTNPEMSGGYDAETELAHAEDGDVLIGAGRTLTVDVDDKSAVDAEGNSLDAASGIAGATVTTVRHDVLNGSDAGDRRTTTVSAEDLQSGKLSIVLDDAGVYLLDEIEVTVFDRAGNGKAMSLSDLIAALPEDQRASWSFDKVVVDYSTPESGIELTSSVDAFDRHGVRVAGDDAQVDLWISDEPWAALYTQTDAFTQGIAASYEPASEEGSQPTIDADDLHFDANANRWLLPVQLPVSTDGSPRDGSYALTFEYRTDDDDDTDNELSFVLDSTDPVISDLTVEGDQDPDRDVAELGGTTLLVGGERSLRVRVRDVLQGSQPGDERDGVHTSGIAGSPASIDVKLVRAEGLAASAPTVTDDVTVTVDEEGWVNIPLDKEGVYDLTSLTITARDYAENEYTVAASSLCGEYDRILVDLGQAQRSLSATLSDAEGTPASEDPSGYYHRGSVDLAVQIHDPWFAAYQAIPARQDGFFSLSARDESGQLVDSSRFGAALSPADFTYDPSLDAWTAVYALRAADDTRPVEGSYDVDLRYEGISGATDETQVSELFGIDYSAPAFGMLSLSRTSPISWNWVFPHDDETVSLGVGDNLSGVNGASGRFERESVDTPAPVFADGVLSCSFTEDAERMTFAQTSVRIKDVAGNEAVIPSLALWCNVNFPLGTVGFSVDDAAPQITVDYDNDDVRNGHYYAANRTATVTIEEANFDFVKTNDERRVVATATCDGSKSELLAKDFENPSGDGRTWVATYSFDRDGDWTFDVSLTDPAGREATPFHDAFTVDTQAPMLMVTWDNNEQANGMYYKATRTATIDVTERNFSAELTPISTTAADGAAPGPQGWSDDGEYGHTTQVYFGNETHYTLRVACTDLAGNVAETFEEPEFVIDLTAPQVAIGGVEDQTAYAGRVAPTISYSDTNFEPLMATYELNGSAQGPAYPMGIAENADATEKHVVFPDFDHTVDWDDVYTLTAKVVDLAGNESSDEVVFSVNRFGSTYMLVGASEGIRGSYLSQPQDVSVREINVSGLDTSGSHAEVVRDSRVRSLERDADYNANIGEAKGWSETTYTFPSQLFEQDGYYRILLTSRDRAGNLSQNTMAYKDASREGSADIDFAVDQTSPTSDVIGVDSGSVYLRPSLSIGVDGRDNLAVDTAALSVDGAEVARWGSDELTDGYAPYELAADGTPHQVTLTTTDRAGNTATATYDNVVVAGDWVAYIRNTPGLLYGTVAGGIGLVAAAAIGAVMVVRHRRATKERRNPFGR